jgi:chemosensory pili system protein ChpC
MLIPLHDQRLLLPNAAVAEIIGYRDPDPTADAGAGIQGMVSWRQRDVPVIDFERLMGAGERPPGIRQRIAVCYAPMTDDVAWPLIGLVSQGIPRLLRLARDVIEEATSGPHGESAIQMRITVGGETMVVPEFAFLQARLATGPTSQSRKSPQSA